jgi:cytoskeletal protein CcmA (bactofilin family)
MIFKSDSSASADLNGFIDRGSVLEGQLRFESQFRVDGKVHGTVTSEGRLIVGEHGEVEAEVHVGELVVSGTVRGTLHIGRRAHLHAGAKVYGDLLTPALIIDDGALFEGKCTMSRKEPAPAKAGAPAKAEDAKKSGG